METKQYSLLANLLATEIMKGNKTIADVKFPQLRSEVEEIIANDTLVVSLFATRVINGLETIDTVPSTLKEKVQDFLGVQSTSILLLVSDVLDGTKRLEDIPVDLRSDVQKEIERYIGKKLG